VFSLPINWRTWEGLLKIVGSFERSSAMASSYGKAPSAYSSRGRGGGSSYGSSRGAPYQRGGGVGGRGASARGGRGGHSSRPRTEFLPEHKEKTLFVGNFGPQFTEYGIISRCAVTLTTLGCVRWLMELSRYLLMQVCTDQAVRPSGGNRAVSVHVPHAWRAKGCASRLCVRGNEDQRGKQHVCAVKAFGL